MSLTIRGARVRLSSSDTWVKNITTAFLTLPDLAPGEVKAASELGGLSVDTTCPDYCSLRAEVAVDGILYWRDTMKVLIPGWEEVEERETLPLAFALSKSYPNPFNPATIIKYELPVWSHVVLNVFNTLGQKIRALVDEVVDAGYQSVEFDASGLASGAYIYRLQAGDFVQTRKMVVLNSTQRTIGNRLFARYPIVERVLSGSLSEGIWARVRGR